MKQGLLGGRDSVLCFGGEDWWYHNNAHFDMQMMKCFARHVPVLYVNSIGMRFPSLREGRVFLGRLRRKLGSIARLVQNPRDRLFVASPVSLPLWHRPVLAALNAASVAVQVRLASLRAGLRRPLLWVACPTAMAVVKHLRGKAPLVYQRTDRYEEFSAATRDYVRRCDEWLAENADLVVYASSALFEECRSRDRNALLVGHAVEEERFDPDRARAALAPADLGSIPRPIVGFFGGIDDHTVDMKLVGAAASAIPDASFVLVGRRSADLAPVAGLRNVHFLGKKEYEEIPSYGVRFDVGIMPWNRNRWIQYCNPIKLKEYLALGIPVVSTDFPEVRRYADVIRVARDQEDFVAGIREALAGKPVADAAARRARVQGDSWDRAMERVAHAVRTLGSTTTEVPVLEGVP